MYSFLEDSTHFQVFDSVSDLVDSIRNVPDSYIAPWGGCLNKASWIGRKFTSYEQVYRDALDTWPDGLAIVDQMITTLESEASHLPRPKNRKRRMRWDDSDGDEYDLDRMRLAQEPWRVSKRESLTGPQTLTIVVDISTSSYVSYQDILWRGAAAIALTHLLEDAGYRVELWIIECGSKTYYSGRHGCLGICLKRPSDPLDMPTLVTAVSGWFFRSAVFLAMSLPEKPLGGLGHPTLPSPERITKITGSMEAILIAEAFSEKAAIELARTILDKIANPVAV